MTLRSDDPDKNPAEVMDTLIPLPEVAADIPATKTPEAEIETSVTDMAKLGNSLNTHYEMLSEQELRMQREEEKYALFINMLDTEEERNIETDTNKNAYTYFD